jgi:hypothetical protein
MLRCKPEPLVVLAVEIESSGPGAALTAMGHECIDQLEQHLQIEVARLESDLTRR